VETDARSDVTIDDGRISVEYKLEGRFHTWEGREDGQGHFKLTKQGGGGSASLHCFPGSRILEGYFVEGDVRGMWRITLPTQMG
jgi:hypothetical protein